MLLELRIQNFAIIDELEISLHEGLNVFTGETGAGKSIILDALGLLCGERHAKTDWLDPEQPILVEALFRLPSGDEFNAILQGMGIESDQDELLIRREVSPGGRSRCRINSHLVRIQDLKLLAEYLASVHSQHDSQTLLQEKRHSGFFYALADTAFSAEMKVYQNEFDRYSAARKKALEADTRLRELAREKARLEAEVEEIGCLNMVAGEDVELDRRHHALTRRNDLMLYLSRLNEALDAGTEGSLLHRYAWLERDVSGLPGLDERSEPVLEAMNTVGLAFDELKQRVRDYEALVQESSEESLIELEERMAAIENLKRRFGDSVDEVLEYESQAAQRLFDLQKEESELNELGHKLPEMEATLYTRAQSLSQRKKSLSQTVKKRIEETLKQLMMPHARFEIEFAEDAAGFSVETDQGKQVRLGREGLEKIRFLLSPNQGQQLMPLSQVASGGEVSRVMLALRRVFASVQNASLLVFDEIDTGIGGDTAHRLARVIEDISKTTQSIVITHLAQMAVGADAHFRVEKQLCNQKTLSSVKKLKASERKSELARMLGFSAQQASDEVLGGLLEGRKF